MAQLLPSRDTLRKTWDAYALLKQAAAKDPQIANDPDFQTACERAHARFQRAFLAWDSE